MRVVSSDSSGVSGGRIVGIRLASMVLPLPGGPIISRLWWPAAAMVMRPLGRFLPADIGEVQIVLRRGGEDASRSTPVGLDGQLAGQEADGLVEEVAADDLDALDHGRLARRCCGAG